MEKMQQEDVFLVISQTLIAISVSDQQAINAYPARVVFSFMDPPV
jgi:hypothetical protein